LDKMVVVDFYFHGALAKFFCDYFSAQ
jgi:hypothetical protein